MKPDPILSLISLAQKAGKVKSGSFMTEESVKSQKAHLVICATDASDRTKKDVQSMCKHYSVPVLFYGTKETLGQCVGKEYNATICITDLQFSETLLKKTDALNCEA